jgi:hypothetical protein
MDGHLASALSKAKTFGNRLILTLGISFNVYASQHWFLFVQHQCEKVVAVRFTASQLTSAEKDQKWQVKLKVVRYHWSGESVITLRPLLARPIGSQ